MTKILIIIAVIVFMGFFLAAANHGLNLTEINECLKWQEMVGEYPDFYLTNWQEAQCKAHNIKI